MTQQKEWRSFPPPRARSSSDLQLRDAIRRVLHVSAGVLAGAALGFAPYVRAALFPAKFELSSLLPANGGDGSAGFVLAGIDNYDISGYSVSGAGDINGDGIEDLVIGARDAGFMFYGESYVVFGRDTMEVGNFPAEFQLSSLLPVNGGDGSAGFVLYGIELHDRAGNTVSGAGDVNGDGIDDLIISGWDRFGDARGECYVVLGRNTALDGNFPAGFQLSSLLVANGGDGSTGFILSGTYNHDDAGLSVSDADVNGDGIDDLVIGSPGPGTGDLDAGATYVLFGRNTAQSGNFPAEFVLGNLLPDHGGNGSTGFVIRGIDPSDRSGADVSAAGDVNGDGIDDLIVGATSADQPGDLIGTGESYVVFGRNTAQAPPFPPEFELSSLLPSNDGDGSAGFVLYGIDASDGSGRVSAAGDVNEDGIDDVFIGAAWADPGGRSDAGEGYVVFGRDTSRTGNFPATFQLSSLLPSNGGDGTAGFVLNGINRTDRAAFVSDAGDVNGDSIDDLIIGAPYAEDEAGESYVVFGRNTSETGKFPAEFELSSLLPVAGGDGSAGFVLRGVDVIDQAGFSLSAAGDVNADGVDDVLIGAHQSRRDGHWTAGDSYVVFGRVGDSDGDGVVDNLDNCIDVENADQRDTNADGYGNVCDADLNNDGVVNFEDVAIMKSVFQTTDPDADLDGDGSVTFADLQMLKSSFFLPPGPSGLVEGQRRRQEDH